MCDIEEDQVKQMAGIDDQDFDDYHIQELLDVYDEVKVGLYGSEDEESDE